MKFNYILNARQCGKSYNSYKDYRKAMADKKIIDAIYSTGIVITDLPGIDIIDIDYEEVKPKELPPEKP